MFDAKKWREDYPQFSNFTLCSPHFSLIEPLAIGNVRALPQQSMATITNIDDIEGYLKLSEAKSGKQYLRVFDLKASDRTSVLNQLNLMGISPGSLFPGIEGVCHEFKDRHFGRGL